jgi:hypothetical protein
LDAVIYLRHGKEERASPKNKEEKRGNAATWIVAVSGLIAALAALISAIATLIMAMKGG